MEKFINELMLKLNTKVADEDLAVIKQALVEVLCDYEITRKETLPAPIAPTIPDEVKVYMVSKKIEGLSEKSLEQYWYCIKCFFEEVRKPLKNITTNDVRAYLYNYQKRRGVSDMTLDLKRLYLNTFFEWSFLNEYITKNPCALIKPIKYEKKLREPLNDIEMEKLRQACDNLRDRVIIETLYSTGCRVTELINLKITDIDMEKREVHLYGKGKKHRISYLNARAILAINSYLTSRKTDSEYLLITQRGSHKISARQIEVVVKRLGEKAGIQGRVFPHRIRHTTATDALYRGMSIEQVQSLMGHEQTSTTLIYAKINQEDVRQEYKKCIV